MAVTKCSSTAVSCGGVPSGETCRRGHVVVGAVARRDAPQPDTVRIALSM